MSERNEVEAIPTTVLGRCSQERKKQAGAASLSIWVLLIGVCLALSGCARELTPFGRARKADTIAAYEEFIRTNPYDPRAKFARDRIEVLRLLEAHRSGPVTMAGPTPQGTAPGARGTDRGVSAEAQPGRWNLTSAPPRRSTFILDLYHGDMAPIPHKLTINQEGGQVTYTLEYGNEYSLSAIVPFPSFGRLWSAVVSADVGSMKTSYGRMASPADYRGNLIIDIDTGTERLSREIRLEGFDFQDEHLRNLLRSMSQMHPQDHSMYFFR